MYGKLCCQKSVKFKKILNEPFCIEGTSDGSKYNANRTLLNGTNLYNNTCNVSLVSAPGNSYDRTECGTWEYGSVSAQTDSNGPVMVGTSSYNCYVGADGALSCYEDWG